MAVRLRCWRFNSCFPVFIILYCSLLITAERDSAPEYAIISRNPSFNRDFSEISLQPLHDALHRTKRAITGSPNISTDATDVSSNTTVNSTSNTGTTNPSISTQPPSTPQPTAVPVPGGNDGVATSTQPPPPLPPVEIYDKHKYYSSKIINKPEEFYNYWKNMSHVDSERHDLLSDHYRLASTEKLKFPFRFYGHSINNVTIATGGFLYMSPFLHRFLTATQYIAPLMANFDTRVGNTSHIIFHSDSTRFTVHWQNVHLKDQHQAGHFSFQVTLYHDHSISFGYQNLALDISKIDHKNHPVKVGLSDAYYIDKDIPELKLRRRTIYEYHKVSVKEETVHEGSIVIFRPFATCNTASSCEQCTALESAFHCKWCGPLKSCSDGIDWYRQKWLDRECKKYAHGSPLECPPPQVSTMSPASSPTSDRPTSDKRTGRPSTTVRDKEYNFRKCITGMTGLVTKPVIPVSGVDCSSIPMPSQSEDVNTGVAVAVILVLLAILLGVGGFLAYAYTHPTTSSGIWLMEHRPSVMRTKLAKIKFWKTSDTVGGDKYAVEAEA